MSRKNWFLPALGVLILISILLTRGHTTSKALADSQLQVNQNVSVIPVQISRDRFGIAMVDQQSQTLWIYEIDNTARSFGRLNLICARNYSYDRLLEEYNTAEPSPQQVKSMLETFSKNTTELVQDNDEITDNNSIDDVNITGSKD